MPSKRPLLGSTLIYKITKTSYFLSNVTANPAKVIAGFIDDLITLRRGFATCERNIKLIVTLLDSLGFVVIQIDQDLLQLDQLNTLIL